MIRRFPRHLTGTQLKQRVARAVAGARAKRSGDELEHYLDRLHHRFALEGRAVVLRSHPKVAGPPNHMRIVEKGGVDYVGLVSGGKGVAFDAKNEDDPATFALHNEKQGKQVEILRAWNKAGGAGFFFVYARKRALAYLVFDIEAVAEAGVTLRDPMRKANAPFVPRVPWVSLTDDLNWLAVLYALGRAPRPANWSIPPAIADMAEAFRA